MRARYPVTKKLRNEFKRVRTELFNYSFESFGAIFNNAGSWAYDFETGRKSSTISFELLRTFFIAQYNAELFYKKLDIMQEALSRAIENKIIKEKTTLLKIFGSIDKQKEAVIIPPKEIFLGEKIELRKDKEISIENQCLINKEFYIRYDEETIHIFSEELFPTELRYIPMLYNVGDEKKLSPEQNEIIENYIYTKVCKMIKYGTEIDSEGLPKEDLSNEYWLYVLYLTYGKVKITEPLWEYIKKAYFPSVDENYAWRYIYSLLEENEFLKTQSKYDDENVIYFRNTKLPISRDNLPIFYVKYSFEDMEDVNDDETDFYGIRRQNAVLGKLSYMDIISLIFRHQLSIGKNENDAFRETLLKIHEEEIIPPFLEFDLIEYPELRDHTGDNDLIGNNANALAIRILDFFDEKEMSGKPVQEEELLRFKDNCSALAGRFFDVISVDFAFIKKLNEKYDKEINRELKKVARDFKKDKILD